MYLSYWRAYVYPYTGPVHWPKYQSQVGACQKATYIPGGKYPARYLPSAIR